MATTFELGAESNRLPACFNKTPSRYFHLAPSILENYEACICTVHYSLFVIVRLC